MRQNLILKVVILSGLAMLFAIALLTIEGVMSGRQRYREQATAEVARSTAGSQTLTGPVLVVAFRERLTVGAPAAPPQLANGEVVLLPDSLLIRSGVKVEERYRGIYRVQVYRATQRLTGVFRVPARLGLGATRDLVDAEPGTLALGVSDSRGLRRPPVVRLGGVETAVEPGTGQSWLEQGFSAGVGPLLAAGATRVPFEIDLELIGTDRLTFVPVGASTHAEMESEWPHPSFTGGFLPDERTVTDQGFKATWRLSRYATGVDALVQGRRKGSAPILQNLDFGVRFVTPVDVYQQSTRAVKYGMLFVVLTFTGFFLFEVLKRMAVHPIQYGMAGAAIAMFFLLLISLSEHVPFPLAYVTASAGCVGLLAFYVGHVLKSAVRGLGFGGLLASLYAVLYVLLLSEDYALLLGSLLLFAVLGAVMIMTRRVDWYRVGETTAS
ncbi:MAG: cell envelope integrity protein CreD [Candidatus Eiseniibacteriota bacterium]